MKNIILINKIRINNLIIVLLFLLIFDNLTAEINRNKLLISDFIVVEITENDFSRLNIQKDICYYEFRYKTRYWIASIISNFKDEAKYILYDAFINDNGIKEFDDMLIKVLSESNNAALVIDGYDNNEHVWTLEKFRNACKDIGTTATINKKDIITIVLKKIMFAYLNKNYIEGTGVIEIERKNGKQIFYVRHTSLIILEQLGYAIQDIKKFDIKKKELKEIKKINISMVLDDPDLIANKIVILTHRYKDYKDESDYGEYGIYTGPEIVCNIILNLANRYSIEPK